MRALSLDLRQRIVAALLQEWQTRQSVAERYCVSVASVGRLARQWREQGHLEPKPIPGRPRAIRGESEQETLKELVVRDKDATLESLSEAFEKQTGRPISISALHRNLRWLDRSHKKSRR